VAEHVDHVRHLAPLIELEQPGSRRPPCARLRALARDRRARARPRSLTAAHDREARTVQRHIRDARFPAVKSLTSFDIGAIPGLNKKLALDLARRAFVGRREIINMPGACLRLDPLGPSGTGKTHVACGIGLAACQRGVTTRFAAAAAIVQR
jgi:DNA replication protein DnaC